MPWTASIRGNHLCLREASMSDVQPPSQGPDDPVDEELTDMELGEDAEGVTERVRGGRSTITPE
jgi:hypothetical protein